MAGTAAASWQLPQLTQFPAPPVALSPFAPPFGANAPLWLAVLFAQSAPDTTTTTTTTTAKPSTAAPPLVLLPYPQFPLPPLPLPPGICNVNCPAVWEPVCATSGSGYMYNFANLCALNAQNCVSGTDFRFLYPGICKLKK